MPPLRSTPAARGAGIADASNAAKAERQYSQCEHDWVPWLNAEELIVHQPTFTCKCHWWRSFLSDVDSVDRSAPNNFFAAQTLPHEIAHFLHTQCMQHLEHDNLLTKCFRSITDPASPGLFPSCSENRTSCTPLVHLSYLRISCLTIRATKTLARSGPPSNGS
jgi:hypothetical protein